MDGGGEGHEAARVRPPWAGLGQGISGWRGRDPEHPERWYGSEAEEEIVRRVAAGETLHRICEAGEPGLPSYQVALGWVKRRPEFAERLQAAQRAAGQPLRAPHTPFCTATFEAIWERLCQGQALVRICEDPAMPDVTTVYRWARLEPQLREALALAREVHGDRMGELAFEEAMAVTPETWRAADVRLRHLRWWAGKLAPRSYGTLKAVEPRPPQDGTAQGGTDDGTVAHIFMVRRFTMTPDRRMVDITWACQGLSEAEHKDLREGIREGRIRVEDTAGAEYCDEEALRRGEVRPEGA